MSANETAARRVLVISGSTRHGSTNSALCRTAAVATGGDVTIDCWPSVAILPHFNPDDDRDPLPEPVVALRRKVAAADAVLFCTPEYAGTLPGSFKNLLDWMVGAIVLTDKPVAWVNVNVDPDRGHAAHATLATVLGYVQARVVESACRHVPVSREQVGPDGLIADAEVRAQIALTIDALLTAPGSLTTVHDTTMRVVAAGPERDAYLPLLFLADDSEEQVRAYYQHGTLFAFDVPDGRPVGMILAIDEPDGSVELKAVAVEESRHGQGFGTHMLRSVLGELRARGVGRVIVGTSSAGVGQLAYYQKAGFRLWKIERDFFSPARGYPEGIEENGIPLRDMVWMDQELL